jgi:hypothetical protein
MDKVAIFVRLFQRHDVAESPWCLAEKEWQKENGIMI